MDDYIDFDDNYEFLNKPIYDKVRKKHIRETLVIL